MEKTRLGKESWGNPAAHDQLGRGEAGEMGKKDKLFTCSTDDARLELKGQ